MENWNKGKAFFDEQEFEKALDYFSRHLSVDPHHTESLYHRALVYRKLSQYNKSLADLDNLVHLLPNDASMISERGVAKFHLKDLKGALNDLDLAQELEPENPYRYSSRAYVRGAVKDVIGAIEDYQKALAIFPDDPIALNNLGLLEEQLGRAEAAKMKFDAADKLSGIKTNEERVKAFEKRSPVKVDKPIHDPSQDKGLGKTFFSTLKNLFFDQKEREAFVAFLKKKNKK